MTRMKIYAYVTADHCVSQRAVLPGAEVNGKPVSKHGDYHQWTAGKRFTAILAADPLTSSGRNARLVQRLLGWEAAL